MTLFIFVFPALDVSLQLSVYNKPLPCSAGSPSVCKHGNHGEEAAREQKQGRWTGLLWLLAGYLRKRGISWDGPWLGWGMRVGCESSVEWSCFPGWLLFPGIQRDVLLR